MNIREALKAPGRLADATQNAVVISLAALVVALIALFAATRRTA